MGSKIFKQYFAQVSDPLLQEVFQICIISTDTNFNGPYVVMMSIRMHVCMSYSCDRWTQVFLKTLVKDCPTIIANLTYDSFLNVD